METESKQIVMAVDDSLMICQQIRAALEDTPFFLCEAHTGEEALEKIERYQPDLILLDVVLPDKDGFHLFRDLKTRDQNNASILFLTSKDTDDDVVKGFEVGACDYIKKPFSKSELKSRVITHLQLKKQKDELNRMNMELKSNMDRLNELAFRDGLTGLYNRRYVVGGDLLDDIKEIRVEEKKNVVILADIDDFKLVNDTYGHEAGDMALVCIASIMEAHCRMHRVVRWGGEEFLIILFNVTEKEAMAVSESIRKDVEQFRITNKADEFSCTLTLGLHVYGRSRRGLKSVLHVLIKLYTMGKDMGRTAVYGLRT